MSALLCPGALIDGRFAVDAVVGRGGMAVVYRATDVRDRRQVAVKLLHQETSSTFVQEHFSREARILAGLHHPHIVSYVAHGCDPAGVSYLVVEWLEGEDLAARLRRGPLRIAETARLGAHLASALGATHACGVVHRDLKPGNIFLRHGDLAQATLLDFGVAHLTQATRALTRTGEVIGTVEYMAPEQVRGERAITPATDAFALGCVLYEALAGRTPFSGGQMVAVLARILFEEPTDIRLLRPEVPEPLAALLARLLAKEPAARVPDGATLDEEFARLELSHEGAAAPPRPAELRPSIQALLTVVVARRDDDPGAASLPTAGTVTTRHGDVRDDLRALGGHAALVLDGSVVVVFRGASSAVDQAVQAAHAALLLRERWPQASIAIATGRGHDSTTGPAGEAFERASALLAADCRAPPGEAVLDEVTANLLMGRFQVAPGGGAFVLRGARDAADESRPLLGRPTPCVGREGELAQLQGILHAAIEDSAAAAVLITGPPGSGKSRLRHEFLRRVSAQGRGALVLCARGEPQRLGAPFGLLGQALRGLGERTASLLNDVAQPGDDPVSERARTQGQDPAVASDHITRAVIDLLRAQCAARPVLLVLDDLHWADGVSLRLLDTALRELAEEPLLVLALARPEIVERFPGLWQRRRSTTIPLLGLPRRACERLIREVLGRPPRAEVEARIVALAAGNALFLEELIRAAAEGKTDGSPETVLAMLQARLSRLPPGARAVLCAASLFGGAFWRGGVTALLAPGDAELLAPCYAQLIDQELIEEHASSRLPGEVEYRFRHDLLRDAAYGLLGERDRALGHELAARYLAAAGERDASPIAEHFHRGGARAEAALWYWRAAEQALRANELEQALERAEQALEAGAKGEERGRLLGLQATAAAWLGRDAEVRRYAEGGLALLATGTPDWYSCAGHALVASGRLRDWHAVEYGLAGVLAQAPAPDAQAALALCLARTGYMFFMQGRLADVRRIAAALDQRVQELPDEQAVARAQVHHFRSGHAFMGGDYVLGLRHLERAIADFERAGDQRNACMERSNLAGVFIEGGLIEEATRLCRDNLEECRRWRYPAAANLAQLMLGFVLTFSPDRWGEAEERLEAAIAGSAALQHRRHEGWARAARARLRYLEGQLPEAEAEARAALELCTESPTMQAWPLGWLARSLVALGRAEEGLGCAEQALECLKRAGGFTMDVSVPPLARIEALLALGRSVEAREAAQSGRRRLLRRVEQLTEPGWAQRLLAHPENARILAHAS